MKKILFAMGAVLMLCSTVNAGVSTIKICDNKLLSASDANLYGLGNGITDCTYVNTGNAKFFSFQASCYDETGTTLSVSFDWLGGSTNSTTYMGIPLLSTGSAMSQLRSAWTTETTYTTLQSVQPPVSPFVGIRITSGTTQTDNYCTVLLNMGN